MFEIDEKSISIKFNICKEEVYHKINIYNSERQMLF